MVSYFFLIFAATIVCTRVALYVRPRASPTIAGLRLHHYMYGIVLLIFGALSHVLVPFAVGAGLFVDELPFLLMGGKTHQDNYSKWSLLGVAVLMIIIFYLQGPLLKLFGFF